MVTFALKVTIALKVAVHQLHVLLVTTVIGLPIKMLQTVCCVLLLSSAVETGQQHLENR